MHKFLFYNKIYYMPVHVSSTMCSSSGGKNCIIQHLVSSHSVGGHPVHGMATYTVWWYQMLYDTILTSWWWAQQCSKHVEAYNKSYYRTRICAFSWLVTKIYSTCSIRLLVQWLKLGWVNQTERIAVYVFCLALTTSETLYCNKTTMEKFSMCGIFEDHGCS